MTRLTPAPVGGADLTLLAEARAGLMSVQKKLPSKCLYDARGIELLEEIRRLPEYYLARAEREILGGWAGALVAESSATAVVELGAAGTSGAELLLAEMRSRGTGIYVPVEPDALASESAGSLPIPADTPRPTIIAILNSYIGTLHSAAAVKLLRRARAVVGPGDRMLLAADLRKEHQRLVAAYNDAGGVMAEFNRNILRVTNRRLGADFDTNAYEHRAFYNRTAGRVELHLVSARLQAVTIPSVGVIEIDEGETIRTGIAGKFDRQGVHDLLTDAGFQLTEWRTDANGDYAVALGSPAGPDWGD